jgi:cell division protein FtsL
MSLESLLLPLLTVVIVIELFLMYLMYIRMKQLNGEVERLSSRMSITDIELEQLTKNIEEFKKLQI